MDYNNSSPIKKVSQGRPSFVPTEDASQIEFKAFNFEAYEDSLTEMNEQQLINILMLEQDNITRDCQQDVSIKGAFSTTA